MDQIEIMIQICELESLNFNVWLNYNDQFWQFIHLLLNSTNKEIKTMTEKELIAKLDKLEAL